MSKKETGIVKAVTELAKPVAEKSGVLIWDVEFKKEGASWFLRVFIDKDGGVGIEDCENVSREISDLLDEADIISQSYYLEVSSPGIERELKKELHFKKYIGEKIYIKLYKPANSLKEFVCVLTDYKDNKLTVKTEDSGEMVLDISECAKIKVYFDYNN